MGSVSLRAEAPDLVECGAELLEQPGRLFTTEGPHAGGEHRDRPPAVLDLPWLGEVDRRALRHARHRSEHVFGAARGRFRGVGRPPKEYDTRYRALRRRAAELGLVLEKSRSRQRQGKPPPADYGTFQIVDPVTDTAIATGLSAGYGMSLDDVDAFLDEFGR